MGEKRPGGKGMGEREAAEGKRKKGRAALQSQSDAETWTKISPLNRSIATECGLLSNPPETVNSSFPTTGKNVFPMAPERPPAKRDPRRSREARRTPQAQNPRVFVEARRAAEEPRCEGPGPGLETCERNTKERKEDS